MVQLITLHFTPAKQDYVNVLRQFFIRRTLIRIALGILALLFGLACYSLIRHGTPPDIFELVWVFLPPLYVVYTFFVQPARMASRAIQNEQLVADATWEMSDGGVTISTRFGSTSLAWDSLARLVTTREYYLLLSKANRNAFRFIPKRAFSSLDEHESFLALIRQHLRIT